MRTVSLTIATRTISLTIAMWMVSLTITKWTVSLTVVILIMNCQCHTWQLWLWLVYTSTNTFHLYPGKSSHGPSSSTADAPQEVTADPTLSERCQLCDLTLGSDSCFNRHIRSSLKSGRVTYKCRICQHKTCERSSMRRHLRRHTVKKFSCRHCSYKSDRREDIRDHIASLHKGKWCTSSSLIVTKFSHDFCPHNPMSLSMSVYIYVSVYVYICVYVSVYICLCLYLCLCLHLSMSMSISISLSMSMSISMSMSLSMSIDARNAVSSNALRCVVLSRKGMNIRYQLLLELFNLSDVIYHYVIMLFTITLLCYLPLRYYVIYHYVHI